MTENALENTPLGLKLQIEKCFISTPNKGTCSCFRIYGPTQEVFTMARTTASTPLEPGPSTEFSSTNNVDRMTKASLVARSKRLNSELSVDDLALLASTVIVEWDRNGQ